MKLDSKYNHPGEYLKEIRLSKKLSLRGLSAKAAISHTEISNIESGERENPSNTTLLKICNALDLNFVDICNIYNIDSTFSDETLSTSLEGKSDYVSIHRPSVNKVRSIKQSEVYALNEVCKEVSEKYGLNLTPNKFKNNYRFSNRSLIDYLCFTDNDMIIGVDVRVVSNRVFASQLQSIKGCFADFYFNFYNSYTSDKMLFFVCFVSQNEDSYSCIDDIYKDEFYRFMPCLNTRLYRMDDFLSSQ